ncbi:4-hydroxybenzoate polyprenyltransferase, mitochondrial [Mycena sanguinolenta]|uniref:4-hydroxybenzoate polyprenyltransferase, mitochondrial n=1 Tax=Mycena sanguinolenta TaxID=230812 RepID=A0A8H7CY64_9AGAR|nr:4-hydroxybenzoate polyprenyltransferase, mitochondrial [Mycena sanguinolenta]
MVYRAQPEISASDALLRAIASSQSSKGFTDLGRKIMTIDDLLDYDIDAQVERTKNRALPRGAISLVRAWIFFGIQVVSGLYLATTTLSAMALYASMPAWPLYIIYPTCKRWTNLAPIPLGLMFKVGIFMGWSDLSVNGSVQWDVLVPIYLGACPWTITYETVYQHQDKIDDMRIGINSPALLCREYTISICTATALGFLGLLLYGGSLNGQGIPFYASVAIAGILLVTALLRTDIDKPDDCKDFFLLTPLFGQIILGGFVADAILHRLVEGIPF